MPYTNGVWRAHEWRDWEIELVGPGLTSLGPLDEAVGASVLWAQYGHGDGSLALHIRSALATELLADGMFYFRFIRDGQWLRDFMLAKDDRGYTVSSQYVDEYIEVALAPLDAVLRGRMVYDASKPVDQFITPDLPIDDAFKWIVNKTCGPGALPGPGAVSRVLAGLAIAGDLSAHATTAEIDSAHKMDLFEFLQKFGPTWGVDWRVRLNATGGAAYEMLFETIYPARGTDKTATNGAVQPIIVNDASGEIRQAKRHRPAVGFSNVILAKSLLSEVQDAASVALYGRREHISDTNDLQRMAALLLERGQRLGYEVVFTESPMLTVGQGDSDDGEFGIGDEVTVAVQHLDLPSVDEFVKEVRFKLAGVPEEVTITFGEHEKTLPEKVNESGGGGAGEDEWDGDCLWVRDSSATAFIRPRYLGDELRVKTAGGADMFYVDANANIGGLATGPGYKILSFQYYDFGTALANGLHTIHMSGDIKSYGSGSYIYWTQSGDGIYSRFLQTTNNADPAAGATGFYVDENGNTTWKAGAKWTIEGDQYTLPTVFPATTGMALVGTDAGVLSWAAPAPAAHALLSALHSDTAVAAPSVGSLIIGVTGPAWDELVIGSAYALLTVTPDGTMAAWTSQDLLDNSHADTVDAAVVRGDLITGQGATPKWTRLGIGASGTVLTSDGADVGWAAPAIGAIGNGTAQWQVPVTGASPFTPAWTALSSAPGATQAPLMSTADGYLTLVRVYAGASYFVADGLYFDATEFIRRPADGIVRLYAATSIDLTIGGNIRAKMTDALFAPGTTNQADLGNTTARWKSVHGVEGNFSGDVTIGTAGKGLVLSANTLYMVPLADGTRFVPSALPKAALPTHAHGLTYTSTASASWTAGTPVTHTLEVTSGGTVIWVYTALTSAGGTPAWRKVHVPTSPHTHLYDKANTPTGSTIL